MDFDVVFNFIIFLIVIYNIKNEFVMFKFLYLFLINEILVVNWIDCCKINI